MSYASEAYIVQLQRLVCSLAERIAAQSELLSQRSEKVMPPKSNQEPPAKIAEWLKIIGRGRIEPARIVMEGKQ